MPLAVGFAGHWATAAVCRPCTYLFSSNSYITGLTCIGNSKDTGQRCTAQTQGLHASKVLAMDMVALELMSSVDLDLLHGTEVLCKYSL